MKKGKSMICISIYLIAANGTMKNTNKKSKKQIGGGSKRRRC
jgi:hypothetical protein